MFLVSTCPFCRTEKIPFDIKGFSHADNENAYIFSICNHCAEPTIFLIHPKDDDSKRIPILDENYQHSINDYFTIEKIIRPPENILYQCPEHVPKDIKEKFSEAAQCHANDCIVASGIMLRLCLETVTKKLLETEKEKEKEEKLHVQIKILFEKNIIDKNIKDVADEIRLDGNYAVHEGKMDQNNLEDLFDFTIALLEDVYTQPKKIELSRERRAQRKKQGTEE